MSALEELRRDPTTIHKLKWARTGSLDIPYVLARDILKVFEHSFGSDYHKLVTDDTGWYKTRDFLLATKAMLPYFDLSLMYSAAKGLPVHIADDVAMTLFDTWEA
jgi:hypothetical protein